MENPTKMDDLGVPLFLETPILTFFGQWHELSTYLWLKKKKVKTQRRFKDGPESRSTTPKMVATTSTTLHDLDLRLKMMLGEKFPQTVGF